MIQLSYQPAFDATHAMFRFLRIKAALELVTVELDKLRIIDYYVLFPFQAADIKLRQADVWIRAAAKKFEARKGYAKLPSGSVLLERMRSPQLAAMQTMAASGLADSELMRGGVVKFLPFSLPSDLESQIKESNDRDADLMRIAKGLKEYPLFGKGGLKDRTGLLEHRYDQI